MCMFDLSTQSTGGRDASACKCHHWAKVQDKVVTSMCNLSDIRIVDIYDSVEQYWNIYCTVSVGADMQD